MKKLRVYELARELDMNNKDLMALLNEMGFTVNSQLAAVENEVAEKVRARCATSSTPTNTPQSEPVSEPHVEAKPEPQVVAQPKVEPQVEVQPKVEPQVSKPQPEPKKEAKEILVAKGATVGDVADLIGVSAGEAVKKLMAAGYMTPAGTESDDELLLVLSDAFGVALDWEKEKEQPKPGASMRAEVKGTNLKERPPIVTVMGHVDHGKTSTLDAIRNTRVTAREAGGITQHIGASHVTYNGKQIVFLDTPGHAAFTSMRSRGAQVTDIAVLVVAADDGVMPQTIEAINHAKAAEVPIIVAVNKMDKPSANPDQVKQQLGGYGLVPEDWGGDTPIVHISAKTGDHIDDLLEMILLVAEMEELKADSTIDPEGVVIESRLDKGKGAVASVIVQQGTLRTGDIILLDTCWGKVRAMFDDMGKGVKEAGPSMAVEVLGLSGVPQPGEKFIKVKDERQAREIFAAREEEAAAAKAKENVKRMTLEDLYSQMSTGELPRLSLVLKTDVQGTVEAIIGALEKMSTNEVTVDVVHSGVGRISESDVMLASASNAVIIGFNVRPDGNAQKLAEKEGVQLRLYQVIYDIMDDVKAALEGLLKPTISENLLGQVEIRALFKVPKIGKVAGCMVTDGVVKRGSKVRLIRDGIVIWDGTVATLRRVKDEASEVTAGHECGITLTNYQDFREGDILECFEVVEEKRSL